MNNRRITILGLAIVAIAGAAYSFYAGKGRQFSGVLPIKPPLEKRNAEGKALAEELRQLTKQYPTLNKPALVQDFQKAIALVQQNPEVYRAYREDMDHANQLILKKDLQLAGIIGEIVGCENAIFEAYQNPAVMNKSAPVEAYARKMEQLASNPNGHTYYMALTKISGDPEQKELDYKFLEVQERILTNQYPHLTQAAREYKEMTRKKIALAGRLNHLEDQVSGGQKPRLTVKSVPLSTETPKTKDVQLKGIFWGKTKTNALINDAIMTKGETARMKLEEKTVTVRCLDITPDTATVQIDDGPAKVLRFSH